MTLANEFTLCQFSCHRYHRSPRTLYRCYSQHQYHLCRDIRDSSYSVSRNFFFHFKIHLMEDLSWWRIFLVYSSVISLSLCYWFLFDEQPVSLCFLLWCWRVNSHMWKFSDKGHKAFWTFPTINVINWNLFSLFYEFFNHQNVSDLL